VTICCLEPRLRRAVPILNFPELDADLLLALHSQKGAALPLAGNGGSPAPSKLMSSDTSASNSGGASNTGDNRVFVEIPKAGPGQGYRAPQNFDHPTMTRLSTVVVWLCCAALVVAPAFVIGLICFMPGSHALSSGFAWLWIVMFLLTESIAVFSAIGIYREAIGIAGSQYVS
jgi:hypothetical protein